MKLVEILGWTGIAAIILAFTLNNFQAIDSDSLIYILLNIYGSFGVIVSSGIKKDFQPVVLNIFWLLVSLISLVRTWI